MPSEQPHLGWEWGYQSCLHWALHQTAPCLCQMASACLGTDRVLAARACRTPGFMSLEQIRQDPESTKSDLPGLGHTIIYMGMKKSANPAESDTSARKVSAAFQVSGLADQPMMLALPCSMTTSSPATLLFPSTVLLYACAAC